MAAPMHLLRSAQAQSLVKETCVELWGAAAFEGWLCCHPCPAPKPELLSHQPIHVHPSLPPSCSVKPVDECSFSIGTPLSVEASVNSTCLHASCNTLYIMFASVCNLWNSIYSTWGNQFRIGLLISLLLGQIQKSLSLCFPGLFCRLWRWKRSLEDFFGKGSKCFSQLMDSPLVVQQWQFGVLELLQSCQLACFFSILHHMLGALWGKLPPTLTDSSSATASSMSKERIVAAVTAVPKPFINISDLCGFS